MRDTTSTRSATSAALSLVSHDRESGACRTRACTRRRPGCRVLRRHATSVRYHSSDGSGPVKAPAVRRSEAEPLTSRGGPARAPCYPHRSRLRSGLSTATLARMVVRASPRSAPRAALARWARRIGGAGAVLPAVVAAGAHGCMEDPVPTCVGFSLVEPRGTDGGATMIQSVASSGDCTDSRCFDPSTTGCDSWVLEVAHSPGATCRATVTYIRADGSTGEATIELVASITDWGVCAETRCPGASTAGAARRGCEDLRW